MNVYKPYQVLEALDSGPTYPYSYLFLLQSSMVPSMWYYFTHPLIDAFQKRVKLPPEVEKDLVFK